MGYRVRAVGPDLASVLRERGARVSPKSSAVIRRDPKSELTSFTQAKCSGVVSFSSSVSRGMHRPHFFAYVVDLNDLAGVG